MKDYLRKYVQEEPPEDAQIGCTWVCLSEEYSRKHDNKFNFILTENGWEYDPTYDDWCAEQNRLYNERRELRLSRKNKP